ncbi:MAG: hypothetical protein NZ908_03035 [Candidatus Micrarchaeota archaeon]|nr:hypothetical protein [Candidatus Micrarchaeota archaeon]
MIHLLLLYVITMNLLSIHSPNREYTNIADISYLKSCVYIHHKNFVSHLRYSANILYTIYRSARTLQNLGRNPAISIIANEIANNIEQNYHIYIGKVIKMYRHRDLCINKDIRTIIIPIVSLQSLEYITFVDGIIPYIGDGSISNPAILSNIITIDFRDSKMCISCKQGRFLVLSESNLRKISYYRVIEGEWDLEMVCIPTTNHILREIPNIRNIIDHLNFCE